MTDERWDELVRRLENVARDRPRAYRLRVAALAGMGYAYIFGVVILSVVAAIAVGVAAVATSPILLKLAVPLVVFAFIVVRATWVKLPPPEGIPLERLDAPRLFEVVDDLRRSARAPRVHRVVLTPELNAALVQLPRLGILGWPRNYLVVGLPMMQALSEEQFRSVIAHELGHLSGQHGRFAGWIYRVRQTFGTLLDKLERDEHWGAGIFRRFLEWYAPYFNAYSFGLARAQEYEADRLASATAGAGPAGTALLRTELAGWVLGARYWPSVFERAEREESPPRAAFTSMPEVFTSIGRDAAAEEVLRDALKRETGTTDTHPSVAARLSALGCDPDETARAVLADDESDAPAATVLLGEAERSLAKRLDEEWQRDVRGAWRERHQEIAAARSTMKELEAADELASEQRVHLARLRARFGEDEDAYPLLRRALDDDPDNAVTQYAMGEFLLLVREDDAGLAHLDRAMDLDDEAIIPAAELAIGFLVSHDREADAKRYRERGIERANAARAAIAERRRKLSLYDKLLPPAVPEKMIRALGAQLAGQPDVKRAYLVRRQVQHLGDEYPDYTLGVVRRWRIGGRSGQVTAQHLADTLRLPDPCTVQMLDRWHRIFRWRMARVDGARIPIESRATSPAAGTPQARRS